MTEDFTPIGELDGPGEARSNVAELARLFPDAVVDGSVDLDVLRDLLGEATPATGAESFGLRWPGMSDARRLSTLPATMTLLPKPDESVDWETTKNIVIEGDNLEVLRLLRRAYTSSVDVIYIDPPYNTGSDFVYNDTLTASAAEHEAGAGLRDEVGVLQVGAGSDRAAERRSAGASHSKWLSMMYPRLLVAHQLLKDKGVAVIAIDDTEHARLKLLLDRVFGAENFISNIVWQGAIKSDTKFTGGGVDYMLLYAKNKSAIEAAGARWRVPKEGLEDVLEQGKLSWKEANGDHVEATRLLSSWWNRNKRSYDPGLGDNVKVDVDGTVIKVGDLSWPGGGGPRYDVLHPVTGKPVKVPSRGWIYPDPETMQREIEAGRVLFGADHTKSARRKGPLAEMTHQAIRPTVYKDRRSAKQQLDRLFDGESPFEFPKDTDVLKRWIDVVSGNARDALILDFFAGSGSTAQATMELNAEDGGTRRYVMVQLDEPAGREGYSTIADITRERVRRAAKQLSSTRDEADSWIDTGFRSYRLAESNVKAWDGSGEIDLLSAVDNLTEGRTADDLLVEMMLRLGIDLVTPVATREVAGSTLYSLAGTLYAFFGTDVDVVAADQVAKAIVRWRDKEPVDSDITVVVRDTGFHDSSAKLNLVEALKQAGIKTFRSI